MLLAVWFETKEHVLKTLMYRLETKRVSGRAEGDSVAEGVDGGSDQAQRTSSR